MGATGLERLDRRPAVSHVLALKGLQHLVRELGPIITMLTQLDPGRIGGPDPRLVRPDTAPAPNQLSRARAEAIGRALSLV